MGQNFYSDWKRLKKRDGTRPFPSYGSTQYTNCIHLWGHGIALTVTCHPNPEALHSRAPSCTGKTNEKNIIKIQKSNLQWCTDNRLISKLTHCKQPEDEQSLMIKTSDNKKKYIYLKHFQ